MSEDELHRWFSLSYASFLVLPRVFLQEMPLEWKNKMAELLYEYNETFSNQPYIQTRVQCVKNGKLAKWDSRFLNYRRPDKEFIDEMRGKKWKSLNLTFIN